MKYMEPKERDNFGQLFLEQMRRINGFVTNIKNPKLFFWSFCIEREKIRAKQISVLENEDGSAEYLWKWDNFGWRNDKYGNLSD